MVLVVGLGDDGFASVPEAVRRQVLEADLVLGGARHLALLETLAPQGSVASQRPGASQRRVPWPSPLRAGLADLLQHEPGQVVVLASGDPMVSGIGTTLVDLLGAESVDVVPAVSSVALARARLGWSAEGSVVVSVVGRRVERVARELAPGRRILVLSSDERTPHAVADLLRQQGFGGSVLHVLGHLGGADESRTTLPVDAVTDGMDFPRLNIVAVECHGPRRWGWTPGLPDDAYEHDGQITKRDLRISALSRLAPVPGEHLWDVGGGSGSVGIEWMRSHPSLRTTTVEADPDRAARIARNAARLGVPDLEVVQGFAPDALVGLPRPDAVFIGGGATIPGVLDACLAALDDRGRIVVHAVTLQTEMLVAQAFADRGGELTRLAVENSQALGRFTGWKPARTITQWSLDLG